MQLLNTNNLIKCRTLTVSLFRLIICQTWILIIEEEQLFITAAAFISDMMTDASFSFLNSLVSSSFKSCTMLCSSTVTKTNFHCQTFTSFLAKILQMNPFGGFGTLITFVNSMRRQNNREIWSKIVSKNNQISSQSGQNTLIVRPKMAEFKDKVVEMSSKSPD